MHFVYFEENRFAHTQPKDFASGLMFILVGLSFSWVARGYSMGTAAKMGPGYFPFLLGLVLALLARWS